MFYFQQMFLNALDGIDTHGITNGVVGIASTILIISFLYGAYQAFSSGGDVRALGISGIKYLLLGLVFTSVLTKTAMQQWWARRSTVRQGSLLFRRMPQAKQRPLTLKAGRA